MYKIKVGTYTLTKPREVTEHYECAAWHQTILVQPGSYGVYALVEYGRLRSISAALRGVVVSACFIPLFGGNPIGPDRTGRERLGTEQTGDISIATYWLGEASDAPKGLAFDDRALRVESWDASCGRMSRFEWRPAALLLVTTAAPWASGTTVAELA